jgi:hypothetical protein
LRGWPPRVVRVGACQDDTASAVAHSVRLPVGEGLPLVPPICDLERHLADAMAAAGVSLKGMKMKRRRFLSPLDDTITANDPCASAYRHRKTALTAGRPGSR